MSILTRGFWKSYWIALRRSVKDKRARSMSLKITFGFIFLAAYAVYIFIAVRNALGFYIIIFGGGIIAAVLMRRWHRKQDDLLNTSLTGGPSHEQDRSDALPQVRVYLEKRAQIVASLLARGSSEIYLQHRRPAAGFQVVTRQIQNSMLRERGLWGDLEPLEAELASVADGCWSVEQHNHVPLWCEQLRILRWVLGIDLELIPLAHFPVLDLFLWREVLQPGRTPAVKPLLKPWDVRNERDIARGYGARVIAELRSRGFLRDNALPEGWADEFRARFVGDSTDLLAGTKTISELDDNALRNLGSFAVARERYCAYLVDLLTASQPFSFSTWAEDARSDSNARLANT
jgi:hypothetical protein